MEVPGRSWPRALRGSPRVRSAELGLRVLSPRGGGTSKALRPAAGQRAPLSCVTPSGSAEVNLSGEEEGKFETQTWILCGFLTSVPPSPPPTDRPRHLDVTFFSWRLFLAKPPSVEPLLWCSLQKHHPGPCTRGKSKPRKVSLFLLLSLSLFLRSKDEPPNS